jgi:hypothetical protein
MPYVAIYKMTLTMQYNIEELYKLTGRDDKVAVIDFIVGSDNYKEYGSSITVVIIYNQFEREKLERAFREGNLGQTHGKIRVKFLTGAELSSEQKNKLQTKGINSNEIKSVFPGWVHENLFYEEKTRNIRILEIPIQKKPKGGDYNWMYGFKKSLVKDGIGLCPHEREWYLAMKYFFEELELSDDEHNEMYINGTLKPEIELKYLEIKLEREIISPEEEKKYEFLLLDSVMENYEVLKKEINSAGLSMQKLAHEKPELLRYFIKGTTHYIPKRFNILSKKAIYLDWKGFLHVFLRHVKGFEIGQQSKDKTKFLWSSDKITMVMENVIGLIDKEIQVYWEQSPNQRFSKYGEQSLYFEGDYYTFHIEANGRLSTFHMTKKKK